MRPYHPANLGLQPYPSWRVIILAWVGKALGIQFHLNGIPFGGPHRPVSPTATQGTDVVFRVDRDGVCRKPERKVVLRAKAQS